MRAVAIVVSVIGHRHVFRERERFWLYLQLGRAGVMLASPVHVNWRRNSPIRRSTW